MAGYYWFSILNYSMFIFSFILLYHPLTTSASQCNTVTFPDQCIIDGGTIEPALPPANYAGEYCMGVMVSSSCDCEPCQYSCYTKMPFLNECFCEILTVGSQPCSDQVESLQYSTTDHSIQLQYDLIENEDSLINIVCTNDDIGFHNHTAILLIKDSVVQLPHKHNVTGLVPSTVYTCCFMLEILSSGKKGPLSCLNISTANTDTVIYGVAVQRISATSMLIEFNGSESLDFNTLRDCHVSYGMRSGDQQSKECQATSSTTCASVVAFNQTLSLQGLVPNSKYCINVTLRQLNNGPFKSFIRYIDLYDYTPLRIVIISSGSGPSCSIWTLSETRRKLDDIKAHLINKLNITEDYVFGEYFEACPSMQTTTHTQYIFRCNIIGYSVGRNSTVLGEMAKEVLEGKPMVVGGVELFVGMVCLDDCQYSTDDDRSNDGGESSSGTNTSGVFLGIMIVLILVVISLIIVIVYSKVKKEIKKKKNNKNLTGSQEILDEVQVEYVDVRPPSTSPPPFKPTSPNTTCPPPYPARMSSISFAPSTIVEEIYDDTMNEKYDFLLNDDDNDGVDAGYNTVGLPSRNSTGSQLFEDDPALNITTTFNPIYSINDIDGDNDLYYTAVAPASVSTTQQPPTVPSPDPTPPHISSPITPPPVKPRPYSSPIDASRRISYTPTIKEDAINEKYSFLLNDDDNDEVDAGYNTVGLPSRNSTGSQLFEDDPALDITTSFNPVYSINDIDGENDVYYTSIAPASVQQPPISDQTPLQVPSPDPTPPHIPSPVSPPPVKPRPYSSIDASRRISYTPTIKEDVFDDTVNKNHDEAAINDDGGDEARLDPSTDDITLSVPDSKQAETDSDSLEPISASNDDENDQEN